MTAAPSPADLDDRAIIARVLAGDHAAFELLVRRHNQRMYRAARAITRADVDAEDVVQQAWLDVYRHLGQFRGDASFASWVTRIAAHQAIAATRKRPIIAEVVDAAGESAPDAELARAQVGALLESCLASIPQGNREVMVLRDVLELDTAETAECDRGSRAGAAAPRPRRGRRRAHRAARRSRARHLSVRRRALRSDDSLGDG